MNAISRRRFAGALLGSRFASRAQQLAAGAVFPGADELTPSRAQYFSWINDTWEGSTENQTLTNLDFFRWLRDEYGMQLDIYALDAGNIDGLKTYGSPESPHFLARFPNAFTLIKRAAQAFGCRLGIWLGPDGFGDTPEQEAARSDIFVRLCRDLKFALFKIDSACSRLRPEKQDAFARMMTECRKHSPDLILLNHRLQLGTALPHATTFLWEGKETYIDVWTWNDVTAPHHRAGALLRGVVPGLKRLTEDHGVCISSCLDYWEDELVLQAFNRCLILAPQIYGNPWLLRDDEFPKLARIFNLHRRYRNILVNGILLPESQYGPFAVSRGNGRTRFLTLRNLTWMPVKRTVALDSSIGIAESETVELRRYHPSERVMGKFPYGSKIDIEVEPFRSCLVMATTVPVGEVSVTGCDYEVVCDTPGKPVVLKLLGLPGTTAAVSLTANRRIFFVASVDGKQVRSLIEGGAAKIEFPGKLLREAWHRKLAILQRCDPPRDAEALYEATCFAADNNALEVRSLLRSGPTQIPEVERARKAFFEGPEFAEKGLWDRNLFDDNKESFFQARIPGGLLRIDFGGSLALDSLFIRKRSHPSEAGSRAIRAEGSNDLIDWVELSCQEDSETVSVQLPDRLLRYIRIEPAPLSIYAVEATRRGALVDRSRWRASNLFKRFSPARAAWSASVRLREVPKGSYLAIPIKGEHGKEGAFAAIRVSGRPVGSPDRSVSFASNVWEAPNADSNTGYTYYVPATPAMIGKTIDVVVFSHELRELAPEVWITCYPPPFVERELVLWQASSERP